MEKRKSFAMKLLSLLLVFCFVLPLAVACDNNAGQGGETTEAYETEIAKGSEFDPKLPRKDYEGYEFTYLTAAQSADPYSVDYVISEGESSDLILDAVYRRNVILEDKYNITFAQIESTSAQADVRAQVMSGNTEFDVIMLRGAYMANLAREKLLYNLNDLPNVDMSKPYWDQNAKKDLAVGNALYFTNCDLNIKLAYGLFFNKQLIEDNQLTSPYTYIEQNNWTLDTFGTLVKSISVDLNNDGFYDEQDRYGATFEHHNAVTLMYASGIRASTQDATGYPNLTLMGDKTVAAYEKIKDIFNDPTYCYCLTCSKMDPHGFLHRFDYARYLFTQDYYLFHICSPTGIDQFADMEHEFGIVPLPKYDASQDRYYSMWSWWTIMVGCPATTKDPDRTGRILEDLNYYSSIITIPEWFDVMLTRKYTRDDESEQYVQIIKDTAVFDMALYFDFGGIRTKILDIDPIKANISTNYAKLRKAIENDINDTYNKFNAAAPAA
ncbi:MAG: extracellular solute-binding protein [Ruminococcaceae bacterium]|nr:extracellular solute-binding protein [Oscillospiraceae bacterium]